MNLAIRGIEGHLGEEPADSFHRDVHKNLKADYILANPPFNMSDWGGDRLRDDPAFPPLDFDKLMTPSQFVGRSSRQVEDFVVIKVEPIRQRYPRSWASVEDVRV